MEIIICEIVRCLKIKAISIKIVKSSLQNTVQESDITWVKIKDLVIWFLVNWVKSFEKLLDWKTINYLSTYIGITLLHNLLEFRKILYIAQIDLFIFLFLLVISKFLRISIMFTVFKLIFWNLLKSLLQTQVCLHEIKLKSKKGSFIIFNVMSQ